MNKVSRVIALILVMVMIIALVASMLMPFV